MIVKNKYLVLDKSGFYPTSGGQLHDIGTIETDGETYDVVDVIKQGPVIIHVLDRPFGSKKEVTGKINKERRKQLAVHHTATHVINSAAKRILGKHINQAGAKKTLEKAHLDVTHFRSISAEEAKEIEKEANKIVKEDIPVRKMFMGRDEAENKFGVFIYQGGAVPGKVLRIVEIPEVDVEACGGTHLNSTKEIGEIKILKTTKIQDGIVRIIFTAGKAADAAGSKEEEVISGAAAILGIEPSLVPKRCEELFIKWKKGKKLMGKLRNPAYIDLIKKGEVEVDLNLSSDENIEGDLLTQTAKILKTQPEHVTKTIQRFLGELKDFKEKLDEAIK